MLTKLITNIFIVICAVILFIYRGIKDLTQHKYPKCIGIAEIIWGIVCCLFSFLGWLT